MLHTNKRIQFAFSIALALSTAALTVACSDDSDGGTGGGGSSGTTSSSSGATSGTSGTTSSSSASSGGGGGEQGGGGSGGSAVEGPKFSSDVLPILTASCAKATCHGNAASPSAQLDLRADHAYEETVDTNSLFCSDQRKLVEPGNPEASQLVNKIKGTDLCGGGRMPPAAPLSDAEIATISDWVEAGALDN